MKKLIFCLLSAIIAFTVSDLSAQTRKSTTGTRKTTTTTKKSTTAPAAVKADISGTKYIGMASGAGQPIDLWFSLNFAEADVNLSFAGQLNCDSKYTATKSAGAINVSIQVNEKITAKLKSTDKGSSMEGTLNLNGTPFKLWLVKIPAELKQDDLSGETLENTFASTDGYTALVKIAQNGGTLCVPADFTADPVSKTWKLQFDNEPIQKMFGNSSGTYSVSDTTINLEDSTGKKIVGKSYDNGKYLELPMGTVQGMTLTLILVR